MIQSAIILGRNLCRFCRHWHIHPRPSLPVCGGGCQGCKHYGSSTGPTTSPLRSDKKDHYQASMLTSSSSGGSSRTLGTILEEEGHHRHRHQHHHHQQQHQQQGHRRRSRRRAIVLSAVPLLGLFSYREVRRLRDPTHSPYNWEISFYRILPLRTVSRVWGLINELDLPMWARMPLLNWYVAAFGCDICEAEVDDLKEYKNLGQFFRRALKPGARPICPNSPIVSPADGTVLYSGSVNNGRVEQVKGVSYSLQAFFGPNNWGETEGGSSLFTTNEEYAASLMKNPQENSLYTCVIYLAPGDYHRFHSPVNWKVTHRRHFAGDLLSVSPLIAKWITGLFTLNERAVYVGEWEHGFFSMTAVGATNVGSIRVYDDPQLSTNSWMETKRRAYRDKQLDSSVQKGQAFGEFNLGSTIVLLFEAPRMEDNNSCPVLPKVKVGTAIPNLPITTASKPNPEC